MAKTYKYSANEAGWETIIQAEKKTNCIQMLFLSKSTSGDYFIGYFYDDVNDCDISDRKSVLDCYVANEDNGWSEGGFDTITEANYAARFLFCDDGFQPFAEYDL